MKRKAGLEQAAARTARAATTITTCALCARPLGAKVEWHHAVPKSEGGTTTVPVHPICHRAIHAALTNAELAAAGSVEAILTHPAIARFRAFVADKPADFHAPTRRSRRRD